MNDKRKWKVTHNDELHQRRIGGSWLAITTLVLETLMQANIPPRQTQPNVTSNACGDSSIRHRSITSNTSGGSNCSRAAVYQCSIAAVSYITIYHRLEPYAEEVRFSNYIMSILFFCSFLFYFTYVLSDSR